MAGKKGQKIIKENCKKFKEYYLKNHPEWTEEQCIEAVKRYNKSLNYLCIEFYEERYPNLSHEEHLKLKEEAVKKQHLSKDTNINYWKNKFPNKSDIELEELRSKAAKEKNKCNLEYWIKKYPDKKIEEIKELYNEFYQKWLSHQEGWGKGDKNVNSKKNTSKSTRNSRSPRNIEFYERKYPELSHEEHLKLLQEFFDKNKLAIKNTVKKTNIEYYLNQGYSQEEAYLKLKERQTTFTLEKCIEKYVEEIGTIKFTERQRKWLKKLQENFIENGDNRSIQSQFAKQCITEICKYFNIEYPKKEHYIYDKINKRAYAYDFYYNHKIIEFNGDYWHCNPKIYDKDFYNKVKQKTAAEIWNYDNIKNDTDKKYNNDVLIIWKSDYNENKQNTIKKCIDFIKS